MIYYCKLGDHHVDDDEYPCQEVNGDLVCPDDLCRAVVHQEIIHGLCEHCNRKTIVIKTYYANGDVLSLCQSCGDK